MVLCLSIPPLGMQHAETVLAASSAAASSATRRPFLANSLSHLAFENSDLTEAMLAARITVPRPPCVPRPTTPAGTTW
jgi:hypothetical protein